LASDQEPVTPVGPNEAMTAVTGANVGTVNHRAPLQLLTPDRQVTASIALPAASSELAGMTAATCLQNCTTVFPRFAAIAGHPNCCRR